MKIFDDFNDDFSFRRVLLKNTTNVLCAYKKKNFI